MAQVRLTKKGVIALVVVLCLFAFGLGFGLWKITGAPNLSPTGSSADGGCSSKGKKECGGCGNTKANGKSYSCKWKNGGCHETSHECSGGGTTTGATACTRTDNEVDKTGKVCNIGASTCQHDNKGQNTGYNCTCIDMSPNFNVCATDWRCTTYDKKKCPTDSPGATVNDCGELSGNCIKNAGGLSYNVYTCKGMSYEEGKAKGCQSGSAKVISGNNVCPGITGSFCGWIQADGVGTGGVTTCHTSWYIPCDTDHSNEDSNTCEGGGVITPTSKVTATVGSKVTFKGYAYDADGINSKITISSGGVALGDATVVDACGTGGDATICSKYQGKKPIIWTYSHTVTSGTETLTASWKDLKGIGGANCDASANLSGTVIQENWSVNKSAGRMCVDENTDNPKVQLSYIITIKNMATEAKTITKIVDTLDSKVLASYIQLQSITPSATVSGHTITWNLTGETALFEPDETLQLKYSIIVPKGAFGTYVNNVEVSPQGTENTIKASESILASCDVPDTALFDSTLSKVIVGAFVLFVGLAYLYIDPFETGINRFFGKLAFTLSSEGKVERSRKKFEKRVVR